MHVVALMDLGVVDKLRRMRVEVANDNLPGFDAIYKEVDEQTDQLKKEYAKP
jgi:hypothetical protein